MLYIQDRKNNTLGILENFYDDELSDSLEDGLADFHFSISKSEETARDVVVGNSVVKPIRNGVGYKFTIITIDEDHDEKVVSCENLGLTLIKRTAGAWNAPATGKTMADYVKQAVGNSGWEIGINEMPTSQRIYSWDQSDTALKRIFDIADKFGAELEFTVRFQNLTVTKKVINIYKKRGAVRTDVQLVYGDNVKNIKRTADITDLVTAYRGVGNVKEVKGYDITKEDPNKFSIVYKDGYGVNALDQNGSAISGSNKRFLTSSTWDFLGYKWCGKFFCLQASSTEFIPLIYTNHAVVTINYVNNYGVNAWDKNGDQIAGTNKKFKAGTRWKVSAIIEAKAARLYQVSSTEYIPIISTQFGEGRTNKEVWGFEDLEYESEDFFTKKGSPILYAKTANAQLNHSDDYVEQDFYVDSSSPQYIFDKTFEALKQACVVKSTYEVEVAELDPSLQLGDEVRVIDHGYEPPLYLTARLSRKITHEDGTQDLAEFKNFIEKKSNLIQPPLSPSSVNSFLWIRYADDDQGTGLSEFPAGKKYMAAVTSKITAVPSDDPADYAEKWVLIRGEDGSNGTPGKPGADGKTPYFHIAYADSADGTDGFYAGGGTNLLSNSRGKFKPNNSTTDNYIIYTDSAVYMTQGQQYTVHANASSGLIWSGTHHGGDSNKVVLWLVDKKKINTIISDANTGTGTTFTWNNPSGTYYLRVNTYKSDNSGYVENVMLEKGTVAHPWSPAPSEAHPIYMGTYTDFTQADSLDPSAYSWTQIKGADGVAGKDGLGIKSTIITYQLSSSGTTTPTGTWSAAVPTLTKGQYLWTRTDWSYTDGTSETGYSVSYVAKDGNNGTDGVAGKDGVGIKSTTITYQSGTSGTVQPTGTWVVNPPSVTGGQYLWTRTVWSYTDGTSETGYSVAKAGEKGDQGLQGLQGTDGKDGVPGKDGVGVKATAITYAQSTSGTTPPTTGWTAGVPTLIKGHYLWTRTVWTYSDSATETGYTVSYNAKDGNNGSDGVAGKDGVGISATKVEYVGSTSGTNKPTSGWLTTVPSVAAGSFLWTKTTWSYTDGTSESGYSVAKMGEKGDDGEGLPGEPGADGKTSYFHIAYADSADGTDGFYAGGGRNLLSNSRGKFQPNLSTTDNWDFYTDSSVYMTQGQQYTVHADASSGLVWSSTHDASVENNNVVLWLVDKKKINTIISDANTGTGTTFTWNNPSGTYYLRVNTYKSDNSGYVENVMLEKGTVAHPWSPAPSEAHPIYMGTYTDFTQADSLDPSAYSWTQVKGDKGDTGNDGLPGKDGVSVESTVVTYQLGTSGTTKPTGTWSSTVPTLVKGQYLWTKTTWNYSDRTSEDGYQVTYIGKDGNNGTDGLAGKDGVGISATKVEYVGSTSGTNKPTSGWLTTVPSVSSGCFLWTKTTWSYTDGTSESGYSVAKMGEKGDQGAAGKDGVDGKDGEPGSKDVPVLFNQPEQPTSAKSGDQWWQSNIDDEIIGYYKYDNGWKSQTIDQAVLNIVTLNAVTINGSTINGSEFINSGTYQSNTAQGGSYEGTTDIKEGRVKLAYTRVYDPTYPTQKLDMIETIVDPSGFGQVYKPDGKIASQSVTINSGTISLCAGDYRDMDTPGFFSSLSIGDLYKHFSDSLVYLNGWGSWNDKYTAKVSRSGQSCTLWGHIKHSGSGTATNILRVPAWAIPKNDILFMAMAGDSTVATNATIALDSTGLLFVNSGVKSGNYLVFSITYVGSDIL